MRLWPLGLYFEQRVQTLGVSSHILSKGFRLWALWVALCSKGSPKGPSVAKGSTHFLGIWPKSYTLGGSANWVRDLPWEAQPVDFRPPKLILSLPDLI